MWRIILPLLALVCLVGCAPIPVQEAGDPFRQGMRAEEIPGNVDVTALTEIPTLVLPNGLLEIGSPQAPHTLLLFVTPGSPYSETYVTQYLPQIVSTWVRQGTLRVHVGFVPFNKYPTTKQATASLLCVPTLPSLLSVIASPSALLETANADCMQNAETASRISALESMISSLHVTLVPTAYIDGERETGLPDWADIRAELDLISK